MTFAEAWPISITVLWSARLRVRSPDVSTVFGRKLRFEMSVATTPERVVMLVVFVLMSAWFVLTSVATTPDRVVMDVTLVAMSAWFVLMSVAIDVEIGVWVATRRY